MRTVGLHVLLAWRGHTCARGLRAGVGDLCSRRLAGLEAVTRIPRPSVNWYGALCPCERSLQETQYAVGASTDRPQDAKSRFLSWFESLVRGASSRSDPG